MKVIGYCCLAAAALLAVYYLAFNSPDDLSDNIHDSVRVDQPQKYIELQKEKVVQQMLHRRNTIYGEMGIVVLIGTGAFLIVRARRQ